jgi:hypothetical protein
MAYVCHFKHILSIFRFNLISLRCKIVSFLQVRKESFIRDQDDAWIFDDRVEDEESIGIYVLDVPGVFHKLLERRTAEVVLLEALRHILIFLYAEEGLLQKLEEL